MVKPEYIKMRTDRFKAIPSEMQICVAANVKALLHAHRDELRNLDRNTEIIPFDCRSGYYGEAFGILRALEIQRFGYFGPVNRDGTQDIGTDQPEQNLNWWFSQLQDEVLEEEGFRDKTGNCDYCRERWGKDDRVYFARLRNRLGINDSDPIPFDKLR